MTFIAPLRTLGRRVTAGSREPEQLRYLTDGRRLYRVVSRFSAGPGWTFAELEDCLTLDVTAYTPGELDAMGLRPVRAWGAHGQMAARAPEPARWPEASRAHV